MNKILCLPIELYKRELDTRLYLAVEAAKQGYEVLLGNWYDPVFKKVRDSVFFLSPGAGDTAYDLVKTFKANGNTIVFHDEEGLIRQSDELYLTKRIGRTAGELGDYHLAWNTDQAALLEKRGCRNVLVAGSTKFDLMRHAANLPQPDANQININTRFGTVNPLGGISTEELFRQQKASGAFDDDLMREQKAFVEKDRQTHAEFCKLIERLGAANHHQVTIRVHPSEDRGAYEVFADRFVNVTVEENLSLVESLARSKVMVHDGCTTALEAKCMGKRVVALRPPSVGDYYPTVANDISDRVFGSGDELAGWLNDENFQDLPTSVPEYILGVPVAASQNGFSTALLQIAERHNNATDFNTRLSASSRAWIIAKGWARTFKFRARAGLASLRSAEHQQRFRAATWLARKFPFLISIPEIRRRLALVATSLGHDPKDFEVGRVATMVIVLRKA